MKLGIITGSGLGASTIYINSLKNNPNIILKDIDLKTLLSNNSPENITNVYLNTVKYLKYEKCTHGTIACNSFCHLGLYLFLTQNIKPIHSITNILFTELQKYPHVGLLSTSRFIHQIPNNLSKSITLISVKDQIILDNIIFNELAWNRIIPNSINEIKRIIISLNCINVAFACTDLSILTNYFSNQFNIIDSSLLHINSIQNYNYTNSL